MNEQTTLIPRVPSSRIADFGTELAAALLVEYQAKADVVTAEVDLKKAEAKAVSAAQEEGLISGGNADTRKAQRATVLAESSACEHMRGMVVFEKDKAKDAEIERIRVKEIIEMTKAWLYGQSGHNKITWMYNQSEQNKA